MGMSASQGRMLMLTSRKSDLELQAQFIHQRMILLSQKTVRFTEEYTQAISNKKIVISDYDSSTQSWGDFKDQFNDLVSSGKWGYSLKDKDGNAINPTDFAGMDDQMIQQMFQTGAWELYDAAGEKIHYGSDYGSIVREVMDETDDAAATATYESRMARLQSQEKVLDLQLKNIDTEHKAIDTEIDAVKKVIQKNIERSFKTFAG